MKAIILAAGINSRLGKALDVPKCLLPFGKNTILGNQISSLKQAGLDSGDITVVVGHKEEMIRKVHSYTIYNPKFAEFDNGYSVYLALDHLLYDKNQRNIEKFLISDGDIVYDGDLISKVINSKHENILVNKPIKYSRELKDEISIVDKDNKILELLIPSKQNPLGTRYSRSSLYSYTGIMKISKDIAKQLHEKLKISHQKWYTLPLPEIVQKNDFYSFEIPKSLKYCFDVDTEEDLKKLSDINKNDN